MSSAPTFVFRRKALAERIAMSALGLDPFSPGEVSVFLAAPRRTGKSTFLVTDLLPELRSRKATPVYVDLWSNKSEDPGVMIRNAVRKSLEEQGNRMLRHVRKTGLTKAGLGSWLSFDLDRLGMTGGATLADGLATLVRKTAGSVVVVVDEAQHAVRSEAGREAMFALKSARDTINLDGSLKRKDNSAAHGLVFTGSHRDKLASLVIGRDQPFFGSRVSDFPSLGRDYTDAYCRHVNALLAPDRGINPDEMADAFHIVGHRPQYLYGAVTRYALGDMGTEAPPSSLVDLARAERETHWDAYRTQWSGLDGIQQAVLRRVVEEGHGFRPFDAESVAAYSVAVGKAVGVRDAQQALDQLRDMSLVVRLERGRYSLDDPSFAEWLRSTEHPVPPAGPGNGP
jgi:hypothetical protein